MTPKSNEFKAALSSVRKRIADAKRHGTHRGFIDYNGCISVCNEFINILKEVDKYIECGEYTYAYSVVSLVLLNCAKLAGSADDSAGGITDTRGYIKDLLEKICSATARGSAEASFIFLQSIKDSGDKAYDGWEEFAYDLLLPAARLAAADNVEKLYNALDELEAKLSQKSYSSWYLEHDRLIRLAAITAVDGGQAAERYISDNLRFDGIRRIAVNNAISGNELNIAEELCLERINSINRDYHWTREWYDMLIEVYGKSDDKAKLAELADDLLVNKHDTKYYAILKQLLTKEGVWDTEYPRLLERLSQNLPYHLYMGILSKEGETRRLFEEIRKHPSEVFTYGKQLSDGFQLETIGICLDEIRKQAAEADNRIKYKKVCGNIKKLYEYSGFSETEAVITELKAKYPRRPAMADELDALMIKLAKKRKLN